MAETRHYLLMCPSNYFSLRLNEVPDDSLDPDAFPCPMTDHGTHDLVRIGVEEYNKRVRINAPNAGSYATVGADEVADVTVDVPVVPQPGDEPAPKDVLGNAYEAPTAIPDPQTTPIDHTGQVEGAVSPESTFEQPTQVDPPTNPTS